VRCTCGAFPPEDALFCHKCGRPLREVAAGEPAVEPPPPTPVAAAVVAPTPAQTAAINFHNRRAVGVSIMVAAVTLLLFIPLSMLSPAVAHTMFALGGFLAANLYARGSAQPLTAQSGARMGFMTCLWSFLVVLVMCTVLAAVVANPEARQALQQQLPQLQSSPQMTELARTLDNPRQFILLLVESMFATFCVWTLLSMLGGMLGAKLGRNRAQ